jgi:hypothetical protein
LFVGGQSEIRYHGTVRGVSYFRIGTQPAYQYNLVDHSDPLSAVLRIFPLAYRMEAEQYTICIDLAIQNYQVPCLEVGLKPSYFCLVSKKA